MGEPARQLDPYSWKNDDEADNRGNPYSAQKLQQQEKNGYNNGDNVIPISNHPDYKYNPTEDIKRQEDTPNLPPWVNNVTTKLAKKSLLSFKKKGAASGFVIGAFIIGAIISFLTGSIAPLHFVETLFDDLNDQLGASNYRFNKVLLYKVGGMGQKGICGTRIQIKCRFKTMSEEQMGKFKDAGFKFDGESNEGDPDKNGKTRKTFTKMTFVDSNGNEHIIDNPGKFKQLLNTNTEIRSATRKAFNPKAATMADKVANRVLRDRYKTDKSRKLEGADSDKKRQEALKASTKGEQVDIDSGGTPRDENGREYVIDKDGNRIYAEGEGANPDLFNELRDKGNQYKESIKGRISDNVSATKSFFSKVGNAFSLTGVPDTVCTLHNTVRAVSASSKTTRAIQLVQFFMIISTTAHAMKAGDITPEEVAFVGSMLSAADMRKQIIDESSETSVISNIKDGIKGGDTITSKPRDNPYYGKNAYDSEGAKVALHNDAPKHTSRSLRFTIGGGLTGTFDSMINSFYKLLHTDRKQIRNVCKVVQSKWARIAGVVGGIASAIGSFGLSMIATAGAAQAISFALPFVQSLLADMIAGTVIDGDIAGIDAGNAAFAGSAALLGAMAMSRGMKPSTIEDQKSYLAAIKNEKDLDVAMERYDARNTPFDVYNKYSFLGSIAIKLQPLSPQGLQASKLSIINPTTLFNIGITSIFPKVSATQVFNEERYKRCQDEGYEDLGIQADVFCNVRYSMSPEELNKDPEVVLNFMIDGGYVDPTTGLPRDQERGEGDETLPSTENGKLYADWKANCVNREDGWGETQEGDDQGSIGLMCLGRDDPHLSKPIPQATLSNFRVYTMDFGIEEAMSGEEYTKETPIITPATPEYCNTMSSDNKLGQIVCKAYQYDNYGYLYGGGHRGTAKDFIESFKAGKFTPGTDRILDCTGLVRMAVYEATSIDLGGGSTESLGGLKNIKEVDKKSAQPGDILYKPGHVELIVANDTQQQRYETFGAHSASRPFDKQIGPSAYPYSQATKIYRVID